MTREVAERVLQLLDEIRDVIAKERSAEKDHSPPPPHNPEDDRRHTDRCTHERKTRPQSTTIETVSDTTSRILNGLEHKEPSGKTFKRVRVTAEAEVMTKKPSE